MVEAPTEGQESPKKVSVDGVGKKRIQQESQGDVPGHLLDRAFLVRANTSWSGWQHQLRKRVEGQGLILIYSCADWGRGVALLWYIYSNLLQTMRVGWQIQPE